MILLFLLGIPLWAYMVGRERTIGGGFALLLGLVLSVIGLFIVYLFPKKDSIINSDAPEQLRKYKELLDAGAITLEEYNFQKAKLLR